MNVSPERLASAKNRLTELRGLAFHYGGTDAPLGSSRRRLQDSLAAWSRLATSASHGSIELLSETVFNGEQDFAAFEDVLGELERKIREGVNPEIGDLCDRLDRILMPHARYMEQILGVRRGQATPGSSEVGIVDDKIRMIRDTIREVESFHLSSRLSQAVIEAEESAEAAKSAKDNAQTASGETAEFTLADEFARFGATESRTAVRFRVATIALISFGILASFGLHAVGVSSFPQAIYNLAILGAIFGLSGYLGRQAGHHRELSVWARTIKVQLLTFESFLDPVTEVSVKDQARLAFASRVFGAIPAAKDAVPAPTTELFEQIVSLANKATSAK